MRIEPKNCEICTIYDAPKLDPITVVLQDVKENHGRLIIECFGSSWSAYWGAMGGDTLRGFMQRINSSYLATKLTPIDRKQTQREQKYVQRIADAVIAAMKQQHPASEGNADGVSDE